MAVLYKPVSTACRARFSSRYRKLSGYCLQQSCTKLFEIILPSSFSHYLFCWSPCLTLLLSVNTWRVCLRSFRGQVPWQAKFRSKDSMLIVNNNMWCRVLNPRDFWPTVLWIYNWDKHRYILESCYEIFRMVFGHHTLLAYENWNLYFGLDIDVFFDKRLNMNDIHTQLLE